MNSFFERVLVGRGVRVVLPLDLGRAQAACQLASLAADLLGAPGNQAGNWTEEARLQATAAHRSLRFASDVTSDFLAQLEAQELESPGAEPDREDPALLGEIGENLPPLRKVTWRRTGVKHETLECGHEASVSGYPYDRPARRRCELCLLGVPSDPRS